MMKDQLRWESAFENVWRDLRYAARSLRKSPGFAAVAIVTLGLGIGATTAIFSLLDAVILRSLPVKNPDELVIVKSGGQYPVFQAFRAETGIFSDLLATSGVTPLDVEIQNGVREPASVSLVSGSYFSTLGVQAAAGRTFTAAEDRVPGEHPVAVASYGYWQRRFGADARAVHRVIRIGDTAITIVGVTAPEFFGEQVGAAPDLWIPLTMWGRIVPGRNPLQNPGTSWLRMIGRLQRDVNIGGAQAQLTQTFQRTVGDIFGPRMPEDVRRDLARATVTLEPASRGLSNVRATFARPLQLLMGAVVLVLLIACANIANLLLARATARRREIDVRLALGVSRGRLIRQLLTESLVLAALGGAAGVGLAWFGREALLRLISSNGSRLPVPVATDVRLLLFVIAVSSATAVLFGLVPAWQTSRANVVSSLTARRESGGRGAQRIGSTLIVVQVAVSLVLVMGAALFLQTIANLRDVDLGFAPRQLIVVDVSARGVAARGAAIALNRRLLDKVSALSGVESVSLAENGVLMGADNGTNLMRPKGFIAGPSGYPRMRWDVVGPRFFSTIGTHLLSGRDFTERDAAGSPAVVAINEELARQLFRGVDPVGQRLVWGDGADPKELEIIAVARDVKQSGPRDEPQLRFYLPYFQLPLVRPNWTLASTRFLVRTAGNPGALAPIIRQLISSEDARLSVTSIEMGPALVTRTFVRERMVAILLVAFGVIAVGLACLGLYGLIAYHVLQRTSEIGIRMALGAQRGVVVWTVLRRALVWIATGIALGVPMAVAAARATETLLFGLRATDPRALIGAVIVMSAMGLLAAYIPARRASRVDPLVALRS